MTSHAYQKKLSQAALLMVLGIVLIRTFMPDDTQIGDFYKHECNFVQVPRRIFVLPTKVMGLCAVLV